MSTLNVTDIDKIANLAKLTFPQQEHTLMLEKLNKILDLVAQMNRVDTSNTPVLAHPSDINQPLRADVVTETNQRDLFQQNAPHVEAGLYIVPAVIDSE
jgi:aspartyl-tRNA(Asn)/glutamyl-tRNA(Gln) amidotransferase subunit C